MANFDSVVIGMYSTYTAMYSIHIMKMNNISYAISTDGGIVKKDRFLAFKTKHHFISGASLWFSPSRVSDDYLVHYGADISNIIRYPFTSLNQLDLIKDTIQDKKRMRENLGIIEEKVIITVGQFIYRKGFDILIQASSSLEGNVGVYIIGDCPTEELTFLRAKLGLENKVHFITFQEKNALREWYMAADLFVLPTREDIWGLVINEAMAFGLPVVTTNKCVAGLELVEDGVNGYVINAGDVHMLIGSINSILNDDNKKERMSQANIKKMERFTIEEMAKCYYDALASHK